MREVRKERRQDLTSVVVVLFVEVSLGMEELNVTDVRRERIPLLWSRVRERTLTKGFSSTKYCFIQKLGLVIV